MKILDADDIRGLASREDGLYVSLLMPVQRAGPEQQQVPTRLKNLTGDALSALKERGIRLPDAEEMLSPLDRLQQDDEFWRGRRKGLACYCGENFFRAYHVPLELPERVVVGARCYLKPLLPLLHGDATFFVLSLTQNEAHLYRGTRHTLEEVPLPNVKRVEIDGAERGLQYHSHRAPSQGRGDTAEAIYHGHGGEDDRSDVDTLHYFQRVNGAVTDLLRHQRAPLVLACVGYLAPLYESANTYGNLLSVKVPGSPQRWSLDELRRHAWKHIEPLLKQVERQAAEKFAQLRQHDRTSDDLRDVVLSACDGRVEALFVREGVQQWGHVDPELRAVQPATAQGDAEDLVDYAAARTLASGGDVFVVESIPQSDASMAATLRYAEA